MSPTVRRLTMKTSTNGAVFVDTSAFVALLVEHDANHKTAIEAWEPLADMLPQVTTWGVVSETYTWLRVKAKNERIAVRWLDHVDAAQSTGYLEIIFPEPDTDRLARSILRRFADVRLSYVDAMSLAILQMRSGIETVFSFDEHLFLSGITSLVQLR